MEGMFALFAIFIFIPSLVMITIYRSKSRRYQVDELRLQKEILELEVKKKELLIYEMHEENKKLDQLLADEIHSIEGK